MNKQILISLLNCSWQWTLLIGVIWLVSRRLKNAPTISHHLWMLTLISLPVLFILNLLVPVHSISPFPILPSHSELVASPVADTPLDSLAAGLSSAVDDQYVPVAGLKSSGKEAQPLPVYRRWSEVLMLIWVLGAMLMLAKVFIGLIGLRYLTRSTLMADNSYQVVCQRLAHKLNVTHPVKVYVSQRIESPISYGWYSPKILIPPTIDLKQFEMVAIHELAHVRRWDWWSNLLSHLVSAVFFFHPASYLVHRQLYDLRERICDDWVIQLAKARKKYADCLLNLDRQQSSTSLALTLTQPSQLEFRVKNILNKDRRLDLQLSRRLLVATTSLLLTALPLLAAAQLIPSQPLLQLSLFSQRRTDITEEIANRKPKWETKPADPAVMPSEEFDGLKPQANSIWSAAAEGNLKSLKEHLAKGIDINTKDDGSLGITPLAFAILQDQTQMVEFLIQQGADVNAKYRDGGTALHTAAFLGQYEVTELLVQKGANVNTKDEDGDTPRDHLKVDWGTTESVASLLKIKLDRKRVEAGRAKVAELLNGAEYQEFLQNNPAVAKAVKSGKISKENVLAGIKARRTENKPSKDEKLKALYDKMLRENPDLKEHDVTLEQLRPRLEHMLREDEAERSVEKKDAQNEPQNAATIQKKVDEFLREIPEVARDIQAQNIARENLEWMILVGETIQEREGHASGYDKARAKHALKITLEVMIDADKLKEKQAAELYEIVFPKNIDWGARYEAYLKANPAVAGAVKSGKITKDNVLAGIKAHEGERSPTEEEQLEALYQKLLKEDRTLGRTPKAQLMPKLQAMLERGEGKTLRPEKSTRQRRMTYGLYFNELIVSGQIKRFDKDLKRVHDIGSAEILRQGKKRDKDSP